MTSIFELTISEASDGSLSAEIRIDGEAFGEEFVDLAELKKSAIASGAYNILTCGCGIAECAGFWKPIFVQHEGDVVQWECDSRFYPRVQKKRDVQPTVIRHEFDRTQYIRGIHGKFAWLRGHSQRDSFGPFGFDATLFDDEFPVTFP